MPPIYTATYSNVPVWACYINNVTVMRRQGDGWVNATHLLKVADFDKPKRTRILEKDVQSGEHEKVQGGYGKYQGTWIPLERAIQLSEQVGILPLVQELILYDPQEGVATTELPKQTRNTMTRKANTSNGPSSKRARKTHSAPHSVSQQNGVQMAQPVQSMPSQGYTQPMVWPTQYSQMPYAGQPVPSSQLSPDQHQTMGFGYSPHKMQQMQIMQMQNQYQMLPEYNMEYEAARQRHQQQGHQSQHQHQQSQQMDHQSQQTHQIDHQLNQKQLSQHQLNEQQLNEQHLKHQQGSPAISSSVLSSESDVFSDDETAQNIKSSISSAGLASVEPAMAAARQAGSKIPNASVQPQPSQYIIEYSSKLLDFFMNPDKSVVPTALLNPEPGQHINQPIDDEGNTVFHWACAIGQLEIMQALLKAGANMRALNSAGQTPLVRAVVFTNNYETRTFPQVMEILADTISIVDPNNRTILHHIASTASSRSRAAGARYYAEIVLAKLRSIPHILTAQGFKSFIDHKDKRGDTALHISSRNNSRSLSKIFLIYHASASIPNKAGVTAEETLRTSKSKQDAELKREDSSELNGLSESENINLVKRVCKSVEMYMLELAKTYDVDLNNRNNDVEQVSELIEQMSLRVLETEAQIPELLEQVGDEQKLQLDVNNLELEVQTETDEMHQLIERSQARDLALLVQQEENKINEELDSQLKGDYMSSVDNDELTELETTLADLQQSRRELVNEIVVLHRDVGAADKIGKYRRLLSICCEIDENEVDALLDSIASALNTQE